METSEYIYTHESKTYVIKHLIFKGVDTKLRSCHKRKIVRKRKCTEIHIKRVMIKKFTFNAIL